MKLRHIKNLTNSKSVDMCLYSTIGGEGGINGQLFADELNYIANYTDTEVINVRIVSEGGEVMAGMAIFSAIVNANKAGKVKVNTYNDGVCASMAGIILLAGEERFGKSFSKTMIHGVSMGVPDKDQSDNDKAALSAFNDMLNQVFAQNTNKNSKYFNTLLSNGLDNWFDAEDAIKMGVLTDYDPTDPEFLEAETVVGDDLSTAAPTPGAVAKACCKLVSIYNQSTDKPNEMKKIIMRLNGSKAIKNKVADTAKEEDIEKVVGEVLDENEKLTGDLEKKTTEADGLKAENEELKNETATVIVDKAIEDGKFNKEKRDDLITSAKKDLKGFKALAASMNAPATRIDRMIGKGPNAVNAADVLTKIEGKSYREVEKMGRNSAVLNQLWEANPDKATELYNKQYNTSYTVEELKRKR